MERGMGREGEKKVEGEEEKQSWGRTTWPRVATHSKGSHSRGISYRVASSAQSRLITYKQNNNVVRCLYGIIGGLKLLHHQCVGEGEREEEGSL